MASGSIPIDTAHAPSAHGPDYSHVNYLKAGRGIRSWLLTLDHKRIGVMYLISGLLAFLLGGIFALLIRIELMTPERTIVSAETYNEFFTLHGAIMIFMFIIPSIPGGLGNFFLPMQIGAKDVAFPRLNLASLYFYWAGSIFAIYSMVSGSVDTGWTFYTPYSVQTNHSVISMTLAIFIIGISSILTGLNFITTVHKLRAPGMGWFQMPLFIWAIYATSVIQVLATPVLGLTMILLAIERIAGIGIFDPLMGGDPVLYQHFFWFYSHPAVYIMILPGMGIVSELITCFSRKTIFGYLPIAFSSIGIALIGFLVWGHHMFTVESSVSAMIFSFLTFLVAVPSAIKVFNWLATLYRGSIWLATPMIYALSFIFLFSIGGLTGVFLGALGVDVHVHDTYFVVAHFHYVMVGGTVMAFIGGLHYWWPKMFGRMYPENWGRFAALLVFFGFNLTFFPQFVMGTKGLPRRYYNYPAQFQPLNELSTVGSWILALGFVIILIYLLWSLRRGPKAPDNPWDAKTLEWMTRSPPIQQNFEKTPVVSGGPYEYSVAPEEATVKP